jgi:uncharacterized protein
MAAVWMAFVVGISGFVHCIGMCGPFALHWAGGDRSLARQLFWHAGRITAYAFLGCLAGFAGSRILLLPYAGAIGRYMAYAAALVMLLSAMRLLGWLPVRAGSSILAGLLAPVLQGMLHERSLSAPAVTGIVCGFLPCPMTWAFLAVAVATSSAAAGAAIMAALGAGTLLPLLALGLSGRFVLSRAGRFTRPAGAIVLIAVAATMVLRPSALGGQCPACQHARLQAVADPSAEPALREGPTDPSQSQLPVCPHCAACASQPENNSCTCPSPAANTADCH